MSFLVPVMMFGWIPITVLLYVFLPTRRAIIVSIIGGMLFLPWVTLQYSGIPDYDKPMAIAVSVLFASIVTSSRQRNPMKLQKIDIPMIFWCFFSPMITSLVNGLGLYDGLAEAFSNSFRWGAYYWVGRRYFTDLEDVDELIRAIIVGGILYVPLCLFEMRMSPQLSNMVYGFFPHSFLQHVRYGHYRPIVFMQHGLMVTLWLSTAYIAGLWYWIQNRSARFFRITLPIHLGLIIVVGLLTRTSSFWIYITLASLCVYLYEKKGRLRVLQIILVFVPGYMIMRLFNILRVGTIESLITPIFHPERIHSLLFRLNQEEVFRAKILQRPIFGWGGYQRAWPVDPVTGELQVNIIDSLFLLIFSQFGTVGLISFVFPFLVPTGLLLRRIKKRIHDKAIDRNLLSLIFIAILYSIDILINGMHNPIYMMVTGVLVNYIDPESRISRPERVGVDTTVS